jgi:hypothetical protein
MFKKLDPKQFKVFIAAWANSIGLIDQIDLDGMLKMLDQQQMPIAPPIPGTESFEAPPDDEKAGGTVPTHKFSAKEYGTVEEYRARVAGHQEAIAKKLEQLNKTSKKQVSETEKANQTLKKIEQNTFNPMNVTLTPVGAS